MASSRFDHRTVASFEFVVFVRDVPAIFYVKKVEGDCVQPPSRKLRSKVHHESAHMAGTRSVTENQRDANAVFRLRGVDQRGDVLIFVDVDSKLFGHVSSFGRSYFANFGNAGLPMISAICLSCLRL